MVWFYAGLVLVSPAILYGVALTVSALVSAYHRRRCPACGQRALKCVNWIRATVRVDGRRAPDTWSYYICQRCGAAHKLHRGKWEGVPQGERHHLEVRA
jgi:hypothetical protein